MGSRTKKQKRARQAKRAQRKRDAEGGFVFPLDILCNVARLFEQNGQLTSCQIHNYYHNLFGCSPIEEPELEAKFAHLDDLIRNSGVFVTYDGWLWSLSEQSALQASSALASAANPNSHQAPDTPAPPAACQVGAVKRARSPLAADTSAPPAASSSQVGAVKRARSPLAADTSATPAASSSQGGAPKRGRSPLVADTSATPAASQVGVEQRSSLLQAAGTSALPAASQVGVAKRARYTQTADTSALPAASQVGVAQRSSSLQSAPSDDLEMTSADASSVTHDRRSEVSSSSSSASQSSAPGHAAGGELASASLMTSSNSHQEVDVSALSKE